MFRCLRGDLPSPLEFRITTLVSGLLRLHRLLPPSPHLLVTIRWFLSSRFGQQNDRSLSTSIGSLPWPTNIQEARHIFRLAGSRLHPAPSGACRSRFITLTDVRLEGLDAPLEDSLDCLSPNPRELCFGRFQGVSLARTHRPCTEPSSRLLPLRPCCMQCFRGLGIRAPLLRPRRQFFTTNFQEFYSQISNFRLPGD